MISTKPNRCAHCRERMPADKARHKLHEDCIAPWLAVQKTKQASKEAKEQKARQRVERAMTKKRKEALKTIPKLRAEAQVVFNAYRRLADKLAGHPCISCGRPLDWGTEGRSHQVDAGHYRSTGSAAHLRFDERNVHAQCVNCNRYGAGRAVDYRIGLVARIGLAAVEALETSNAPHKWERSELIALKARYTAKLKQLKEST